MFLALPFPPKELFPNAKRKAKHWSAYSGKARNYRTACKALVLEAKAKGTLVAVTFHPPDARSRDDDGLIGAFKAGRDGVADALKVDDKTFRPTYAVGEIRRPLGEVVVEIREGDA
jgi:crossover junction endodeoxyribonuclease RusA